MKKRSIWQRALAVLLAVAMCLVASPVTSWAELIGTNGAATLEIAYDADGDGACDLVVNKSYRFFGDHTLGDLFAAAKAAGDISDYAFKDSGYGSYIDSVTLSDGTVVAAKSDFSEYWANYKNGGYASGSACTESDALASGDAFQFGYEGYPSGATPYDWSKAPAAEVSSTVVGQIGGARLLIAYDSDGDGACDLVLNKVYGFHDGATLGDLFAAAKAAGDISDYAFKDSGYGSYIDSVTLSDGTVVAAKSDFSEYWANYKNGGYASGSACTESDALASGDAFQFGYEGYPSGATPYDWSKAPAPVVSAQVAGEKSDPAPTPDPTPVKTYAYDAKTASTLMDNLAVRFAKGGKDAAISNATVEGALALNSLGRGSELDSAAILKSFEGYSDANEGRPMGAGQYGKYILALTAAGVDCTKVTFSDGSVHNLVSEMEALVDKGGLSVYDEVWVLPVYRTYADASGRTAKLIDGILDSVDSDGLFGNVAHGCDTQTSAQAILALLPYRNVRTDVSSAIEKAESAILALQNEDGGFGYSASFSTSNLDATGEVVAALTALGHNCANGSDVTTANGSTPIGWLCGMADADLAGFLDNSDYNESQSSAAILLGLAADAGRQAAGGSYDVYALKTVTSGNPEPSGQPDATPKPSDDETLPATGDGTASIIVVSGVVAAGALLVVESRRRAA